jgi:hypothetical protein
MIMRMPERTSLTRLCAPKASAIPPTPADASSGPSGRPRVAIIVSSTMMKMTKVDVLLRIVPMVAARCVLRASSRPVAWDRTREARWGV